MKIAHCDEIDADLLFLSRLHAAELVRFIGEVSNTAGAEPVVRRAENGEYVILSLVSDYRGQVLDIRKFTPPRPPIDVTPSWSLILGNILAALADARRRILGR